MLGNKLEKGSFVAYGARSGNSGELRMGIITNVKKGSIVSGTGSHRTYNWEKKKEVDEWTFSCSGVQGHGVDGSRLLKLEPEHCQEVYDILYEKAKKYL